MNSKKLFSIFLSILFCLSLTSCKNQNSVFDLSSNDTNYNNIYQFAHDGFWIDNDSIYYTKSGFYWNTFYSIDKNGKQKIVSDSLFDSYSLPVRNAELSQDIQAYNNNVYFWCKKEDINYLLAFDKQTEKTTACFDTEKNIRDWAVFDNIVVFSVFEDSLDIDENSLWYYDLSQDIIKEICPKTSGFGIINNQIRYVVTDEENCQLYSFDTQNAKSGFICCFKNSNDICNQYNFTENAVVFFNDGLNVFDIKTESLKKYSLQDKMSFMSCYKDYAFIVTASGLYRINLNNGESNLLYGQTEECYLVHALSDECAIIVCYEDSLLKTSINAYKVTSDGVGEKILTW